MSLSVNKKIDTINIDACVKLLYFCELLFIRSVMDFCLLILGNKQPYAVYWKATAAFAIDRNVE